MPQYVNIQQKYKRPKLIPGTGGRFYYAGFYVSGNTVAAQVSHNVYLKYSPTAPDKDMVKLSRAHDAISVVYRGVVVGAVKQGKVVAVYVPKFTFVLEDVAQYLPMRKWGPQKAPRVPFKQAPKYARKVNRWQLFKERSKYGKPTADEVKRSKAWRAKDKARREREVTAAVRKMEQAARKLYGSL